jgi:translocator protein
VQCIWERIRGKEEDIVENEWYRQLVKPKWAPPAWIFGPVWLVLYLGILVTYGAAAFMVANSQISWFVFLPFALNIVFNLAFPFFQVSLRNNELALLDIVLVLLTLLWALLSIYPYAPWISWTNIPYLLWVSFATVLQSCITWLNR